MSSPPKKYVFIDSPPTPPGPTVRPRRPKPKPVRAVPETYPQDSVKKQTVDSPNIVRSHQEEDPFTFIRKSPKPGRNPTKRKKERHRNSPVKTYYVPNLRENATAPRWRQDELEGDQSPVALRTKRSSMKKEKARQNEDKLEVPVTPMRRISPREPKPKSSQENPLAAEMWPEEAEVEVSPKSSGGKDYVPSPKSSENSPVGSPARQNEDELEGDESPVEQSLRRSGRKTKVKPPQEDPLAEIWWEESEVEESPNSSGGKDYVPSPKSSEKSPVAIPQPEEPAKVKANAKVKREHLSSVIPPGQKSHSKVKGKSDSGVKKQRKKPKKRAHADRIFRGGRAIPRGGVDIPLRRSARIQEKAEKNEQN
ncbi:hypothetical protein RUND412_009498 [Rhizina undulata]